MLGIGLIPVVIGMGISFVNQIAGPGVIGNAGWLFIGGAAAYFVMHYFIYKPITIHTFAHELTHAIWSWMFGGKLKQFNVSGGSGNVVVTVTNIFVRLAPYFFPLYAILAMVTYGVISLLVGDHRYFSYAAIIMGVTIAFHVAMTIRSLRVEQSDLTGPGYVFSMPFILIMNMIVMILFCRLFFARISLGGFFVDTIVYTGSVWGWLIGQDKTY